MEHSPQTVLVFASSGLIYGRTGTLGIPLCEDALLAPLDEYAASKAAADLALGALGTQGLSCVRIRTFNLVGPGQSSSFVVSSFARQIARIEAGLQPPVMHVGNLSAERDFLDVRDAARAYALVLGKVMAPGTILNVASGRTYKIHKLLDWLLQWSGTEIRIEVDPQLLRLAEVPTLAVDPNRARELLDWMPQYDIVETMRDVLTHWRAVVAKHRGELD